MRQRPITVMPMARQHHIRKIIILINNQVYRQTLPLAPVADVFQSAFGILLLRITIQITFPQQMRVLHVKVQVTIGSMRLKRLSKFLRLRIHHCKIELQYQIGVLFTGRMLPDIILPEQLLETFLLCDIIITRQHRQPQRLPEPPRTYQKKIRRTLLHFLNKTCLVHIIIILRRNRLKIRHPVRYLLRRHNPLF